MKFSFILETDEGGEDCFATFDAVVTYEGHPAFGPSWDCGGEPAAPMEFDIKRLECFYLETKAPVPKELWPEDLEDQIQTDNRINELVQAAHAEREENYDE